MADRRNRTTLASCHLRADDGRLTLRGRTPKGREVEVALPSLDVYALTCALRQIRERLKAEISHHKSLIRHAVNAAHNAAAEIRQEASDG